MIYRMHGDTVQLLRYKITQADDEKTDYWCASEEERDEIIGHLSCRPHTVEAVDQAGNEWIGGMEFKDASQVPKALEMGEDAWRERVNANDSELQMMLYLTDLDFRVLLLEWGVV